MRALNKDIRVDQGLLDHPKYRRLKKLVGPLALEHLEALWMWTAENHFKGTLYDVRPVELEAAARWDGADGALYSALVEVRLVDVAEDGTISIHDWEEHQNYVYESDKRSEKAAHAVAVREAKRRLQDNNKTSTGYLVDNSKLSPTPTPTPTPNPREDKDQEAGYGKTPPTEPRSSGCPHGDLRTDQEKADDSAIVAELDKQTAEREAKEAPIPYEDIVAAYHEKLPTLPKCRAHGAGSKIRDHLKARWEQDESRRSLVWWQDYFTTVGEMPFLMGNSDFRDGRDPFIACLAWLVLPTNMEKILNGFYKRTAQPAPEVKPDCKWCLCTPCVCEVEYDDRGNVLGKKVHAHPRV